MRLPRWDWSSLKTLLLVQRRWVISLIESTNTRIILYFLVFIFPFWELFLLSFHIGMYVLTQYSTRKSKDYELNFSVYFCSILFVFVQYSFFSTRSQFFLSFICDDFRAFSSHHYLVCNFILHIFWQIFAFLLLVKHFSEQQE